MDVTGSSRLFGPSVDIAFRLKKAFKKTFNLDPVWSVATNKLIAKVATRVVKPSGEYIVAPGDEKAFLAPLPLHLIPGLIKSDLTRFKEFNLFSICQARALTMEQLEIPCHNRASLIHDYIRGVDTAPVAVSCKDFSSIYADHEFSEDTNSAALLKQALYFMVEKICKNLRDRKLTGAVAKIIISYSDGMQKSSKLKITPSTYNDMIMFKKCSLLLDKAWTRRVRIRHMRLVCEKLSAPQFQADLFACNTKKNRQADLIAAMDKIRAKFGRVSIKTGLAMMVSDPRQARQVRQVVTE
jgi:DNA polymerase-4